MKARRHGDRDHVRPIQTKERLDVVERGPFELLLEPPALPGVRVHSRNQLVSLVRREASRVGDDAPVGGAIVVVSLPYAPQADHRRGESLHVAPFRRTSLFIATHSGFDRKSSTTSRHPNNGFASPKCSITRFNSS